MKKKLLFCMLLSVLSFSFSNSFKENITTKLNEVIEENPSIYKSIYIGDENNNIYYEYNGSGIRALASLTKLMNAILVIDDIREGKYNFDTKIKVTQEASKVRYGVVLKKGKEYTIDDLLKLLLINSSNSAAYLLAQYSSDGNVNDFVKRMNDRAKLLNLKSIKYHTPHGLPPIDSNADMMDRGNARDLYLLALEVLNYPEILNITNNEYIILSDKTKIKSTNSLINRAEMKGLKTGYHRRAMYNIINYLEFENGEKIIEVILGSRSSNLREKVGLLTIDVMENGGN